MSKDDRISIKKYYETLFRGEQKRWPSLDRMAWLIDQIVESKYGEIFFLSLSCTASLLFIELSDDWRDLGELPHITIQPGKNILFHYCRYNEIKHGGYNNVDEYFDEYQVAPNETDRLKEILFELLERLKNFADNPRA